MAENRINKETAASKETESQSMNSMAKRFEHIVEEAYPDCLVLEARIKAEFLHVLVMEAPNIVRHEEVQAGLRLALEELAWLTRRAEEALDEQAAVVVDRLSGEETELLALYRQSGSQRGGHILDYARGLRRRNPGRAGELPAGT